MLWLLKPSKRFDTVKENKDKNKNKDNKNETNGDILSGEGGGSGVGRKSRSTTEKRRRSSNIVETNLQLEAESFGVEKARIVFAERVGKASHLARHKHAGLFLDTFFYGAHSTATVSGNHQLYPPSDH